MFNITKIEKYFKNIHNGWGTNEYSQYLSNDILPLGTFVNGVSYLYLNAYINMVDCLTGIVLENKYKNTDIIYDKLELSDTIGIVKVRYTEYKDITKINLIEHIKKQHHPKPCEFCDLSVFLDNVVILAKADKELYYLFHYNASSSGIGRFKTSTHPNKIKDELYKSFNNFLEIPEEYMNLGKIYQNDNIG